MVETAARARDVNGAEQRQRQRLTMYSTVFKNDSGSHDGEGVLDETMAASLRVDIHEAVKNGNR